MAYLYPTIILIGAVVCNHLKQAFINALGWIEITDDWWDFYDKILMKLSQCCDFIQHFDDV